MSVRSTLNAFNRCFLIFGVGSINYNQGTFKMTMIFYILRFTLICCGFKTFYEANILATFFDLYMFDITSVIMMSIFEIIWFAKVISHVWRIFFDNQLSVVLTKLEETHDKLIHLNAVRPLKIKMKWFVIPGIIVHLISSSIILIRLLILKYLSRETENNILSLVAQMVTNICECVAFYEYILLILYTQWMVYIINEQILLRYSTISTSRDMYLEVVECLNDINRSIYGLPAIMGFISANVGDTIFVLYSRIIFTPTAQALRDVFVLNIITLSTKLFNVILLYAIGLATEKEINRMSLVLHQRSVIERNPRIKRQIKFFILRRLHEHYHFEVCGIFEISLRKLLFLLNKAIAYLFIQILFRLNKDRIETIVYKEN